MEFLYWHGRTSDLLQLCHDLVPIHLRTTAVREPIKVVALIDYETPHIKVAGGK